MFTAFLIKYAEIGVKGRNRYLFEDALVDQIRFALSKIDGEFAVRKTQGRIYVDAQSAFDFDETVEALKKVFGISGICPVVYVEDEGFEKLSGTIVNYVKTVYPEGNKTFKVCARRARKNYPMRSMEINCELGGVILDACPDMKVDVHHPDFELNVEIREKIYIYSEIIPGPGGMPVGTGGKAMLLLSGGIDSPAAGYMIAKRGVEIDAVYFETPPYTGDAAREKVMSLAKILAGYTGKIYVNTIPITEIQQAIADNCEEKYFTILLRRFMMRLAEKTAKNVGCSALVTGESVGQVASQTIEALYMTNSAVSLPVFRPCIGMVKDEIVTLARKIGTFETSSLPYDDCCVMFTPHHPCLRPTLDEILEQESRLDVDALTEAAFAKKETTKILL